MPIFSAPFTIDEIVLSARIRTNVGLILVRTLKNLLNVATTSWEQDMGTNNIVCVPQ
jgi:hypothetical protein